RRIVGPEPAAGFKNSNIATSSASNIGPPLLLLRSVESFGLVLRNSAITSNSAANVDRLSGCGGDPPPLKWSDLRYVFDPGGLQWQGSDTSLKRSLRSCGRSMFWSRRVRTWWTQSARSG